MKLAPDITELSFGKRALLLGGNLVSAFRLVAEVSRYHAYTYAVAAAAEAVLPVPIAWVGKEIVDAVLAGSIDQPRVLQWVLLECVLVIARILLSQRLGYQGEILRGKLVLHVDERIFKKAQSLSLMHFEDAKFVDQLERARKESSWRPIEAFTQGFAIVRNACTVVGLAGILARFSPFAALAVIGAALPFLAEAHFTAKHHQLKVARTMDERRAGYFGQLLTSESYQKEVKMFQLSDFFLGHYRRLLESFQEQDRLFALQRGVSVALLYTLSTAVFYAVFAWIALSALHGLISIGAMTMYLASFRQAQSSLSTAMNGLARTLGDALYLQNLFSFLELAEDERAPERSVVGRDAPAITFRNVSFSYPGSERVALARVSVHIEPGQTVAIVGKNGAGKSTVVKLLSGLYLPTSGTVSVAGVELNGTTREQIRAQVGVVLQDFAHYHFSAAENIGLGDVHALADRARVEVAAKKGGADDVVARLPDGFETMLGKVFGGEQLSTGQWQRIALARAFMRDSPILILDEPTSAIDPEGEYALFVRMKELARGKTCLLITHRFSTVRMADRILVFEAGQIVEDGTHAELLAQDGTYARMFSLQAEGYR